MTTNEAMAHEVKEPGLFKLVAIMTATTTLAGIVLGIIAFYTMPIAVENDRLRREKARKELLPSAASFQKIEGHEGWFVGRDDDGEAIGYIARTSEKGYGGSIVILVGIDNDFKIMDYRIIQHNETPGLGEIAKREKFRKKLKGRGLGNMEITKRGEEGKIEAITGATITTVAVVDALKKALEGIETMVAKGIPEQNPDTPDKKGEGDTPKQKSIIPKKVQPADTTIPAKDTEKKAEPQKEEEAKQ